MRIVSSDFEHLILQRRHKLANTDKNLQLDLPKKPGLEMRFLASGSSFAILSYQFKISKSVISGIVQTIRGSYKVTISCAHSERGRMFATEQCLPFVMHIFGLNEEQSKFQSISPNPSENMKLGVKPLIFVANSQSL